MIPYFLPKNNSENSLTIIRTILSNQFTLNILLNTLLKDYDTQWKCKSFQKTNMKIQ